MKVKDPILKKIFLIILFFINLTYLYADAKEDLLRAAAKGEMEVIKKALKNGADVNAENDFKETALMIAAKNGHLESLNYLIEHGADINKKGRFSFTALWEASAAGHYYIVKLLLEKGAKY